MKPENEQLIADVQSRLDKCKHKSWRWSHCYEKHDGVHWALVTDESEANNSIASFYMMLDATEERCMDGTPLNEHPDLILVANAPDDLRNLLTSLLELESENARLRAELSTQETLVATLQEQQYAWDELQADNTRLRTAIEDVEPPECKYPNLCRSWEERHEPDCYVLRFHEWKRNALKEGK